MWASSSSSLPCTLSASHSSSSSSLAPSLCEKQLTSCGNPGSESPVSVFVLPAISAGDSGAFRGSAPPPTPPPSPNAEVVAIGTGASAAALQIAQSPEEANAALYVSTRLGLETSQDYIQCEHQHGAHNYKPLPVVLHRGAGPFPNSSRIPQRRHGALYQVPDQSIQV
eukprot:GHVT01012986.1.p1 GENE.GHVT01012986.1~~GHVT01012986.1.p1  ORF type:complete len:168 (+),score=30.89 GHVT01012986.1:625-1128(+)